MPPRILKADGSLEAFNRDKLLRSLLRSGAAQGRAEEITQQLEREVKDGMTTGEIYHRAFTLLQEHKKTAAARYSLKRALLDFGPSGFPFEAYLAEMFRAEGYSARIDQIIQGKCVEHEVDVVATKGNQTLYVEAKFHNNAGFKTDLQTALYVKARLEDIAARPGNPEPMQGLLVTNTKFTSLAVAYAQCAGVELLGWEYPDQGNLHDRIDAANVYPITELTTLNKQDKIALLGKKIVLCNHLVEQGDALLQAGVSRNKIDSVFSEAAGLCIPGNDI